MALLHRKTAWLPAWLLALAITTGAFTLAFRCLTWAYFGLIWQHVFARTYVGGDWRYHFFDTDAQAVSYGRAAFVHTVEGIEAEGYTQSASTGLGPNVQATWKARAASIEGNQITLAVTLTGRNSPMHGFKLELRWLPENDASFRRAREQLIGGSSDLKHTLLDMVGREHLSRRSAARLNCYVMAAPLRREGLYSSHLFTWRQLAERGEAAALTPKKRGPQPKANGPLAARVYRIESSRRRRVDQRPPRGCSSVARQI